MNSPFYIKDQIKKEFSEVTLPAIQIDYIQITDKLKPDFRQADTWPEQSPLDETGLQKPEFQFDKELTANVFKSGFNFHAPQFEDVEIFPHHLDNYANLISSFQFTKYLATDSQKLSHAEPKSESIKLIETYMVNEIKFSTRLNQGFLQALQNSNRA